MLALGGNGVGREEAPSWPAPQGAPMTDTPFPRRTVKCPGCGGRSVYAPDNPYRPFCSPRCKNNDFGAWAGERYGVPAKTDPGDDPADPAPDTHH
jgi:uncharacterized protein